MKKIMALVLVIAAILGVWSGLKKAYATEEVNEETREVYKDFGYEIEDECYASIEELRDMDACIESRFERTDNHAYAHQIGIDGYECTCGMDSCILEVEYQTTEGLVVVHGCYRS